MEFRHEPVLLQEVLWWMNVRPDGVYCDGTLGGGGHRNAAGAQIQDGNIDTVYEMLLEILNDPEREEQD